MDVTHVEDGIWNGPVATSHDRWTVALFRNLHFSSLLYLLFLLKLGKVLERN